jgi:hypothetical protein
MNLDSYLDCPNHHTETMELSGGPGDGATYVICVVGLTEFVVDGFVYRRTGRITRDGHTVFEFLTQSDST